MRFGLVRTFNGKLVVSNLTDTVSSSGVSALGKLALPLGSHLRKTVKAIDDTLGVSQVNEAQDLVQQHEQQFLEARSDVHDAKKRMADAQMQLNETRNRLDRCDRHHENYLQLVAEEHKHLLNAKALLREFDTSEERERRIFAEYSGAVRLSHEKERAKAERTKYLSIIGSIAGTLLGFLCSSLVTHERLKKMRSLTESAISGAVVKVHTDMEENSVQLLKSVETLQENILKPASVAFSDQNNVADVSIQVEKMVNEITGLCQVVETLSTANEENMKKFASKIVECLPVSQEDLHAEFTTLLEEFKTTTDQRIASVSEELKHEIFESVETSRTQIIDSLPQLDSMEEIGIVNRDRLTIQDVTKDYMTKKNLNILLGVTTAALLALTSWNDML